VSEGDWQQGSIFPTRKTHTTGGSISAQSMNTLLSSPAGLASHQITPAYIARTAAVVSLQARRADIQRDPLIGKMSDRLDDSVAGPGSDGDDLHSRRGYGQIVSRIVDVCG
jgi:hypothetical protein